MTEREVARHVVAELQRWQWTVYQEVQVGREGKRADIVAVDHCGRATIVEVKGCLSLSLLDQLCSWSGYANRVVGAYLQSPIYRKNGEAAKIFACATGIGLWAVENNGNITERVAPRIARLKAPILKWVCPEQMTGEWPSAGSPSIGRRLTPFARTVLEFSRIVAEEPGISLKAALGRMSHHYCSDATARSAIAGWLGRGIITTVRAEGGPGKPLRLYPAAGKERCGDG